MCSPLRETCIRCEVGLKFTPVKIVYDRECCKQCPEQDVSGSRYDEKVAAYQQGLYHHNPCQDCGKYNRCATMLNRGFLD